MARQSETTTAAKRKSTSTSRSGGNSSGRNTKSTSRSTSSNKRRPAQPEPPPIRREVCGVICLILAMLFLIGYFDVDALFFRFVSGTVKGLIGYGYWILPVSCLWAGVILLTHRGRPVVLRVTSVFLLPVLLGILWHVLCFGTPIHMSDGFSKVWMLLYTSGTAMNSGGAICGLLALGLDNTVSVYGAVPILLLLMALFGCIGADLTLAKIVEMIRTRPVYNPADYPPVQNPIPVKPPKIKEPKKSKKEKAIEALPASTVCQQIHIPIVEPTIPPEATVKTDEEGVLDVLLDDEYEVNDDSFFMYKKTHSPLYQPIPEAETIEGKGIPELEEVDNPTSFREIGLTPDRKGTVNNRRPVSPFASGPVTIDDDNDVVMPEPSHTGPQPSAAGMGEFLHGDGIFEEPNKKLTKKETAQGFQEIAAEIAKKDEAESQAYVFPPMNLLRSGARNVTDSQSEAGANRRRLETTLSSFGVDASYVSCTRGPTVTRYDFELHTGVKLNKVTNLADDIALSLGASSVRIAPIPDKISTVGIEVPNKVVNTVYLRDIIGSDNFSKAKSKVSFAIGEDIGGNSIVSNIAKLPHLLIAGTTGSGKSVCINCLLLSLLYKATPDEVKLIMIDPKMVELGVYNGIPHLYVPVVTDPKKAAGALQWSVVEMMKRYRLFSEAGVRDLAGYNAVCERNGDKKMPQVVIVIDELADLMMVASKEVEESICRVAQMGRAAGMHLVIATQRPSADVITGLMKANIPSRIAFAVSSALESRIILDQQGAEKLIGMGDMLYAPIGVGKPVRIQGAFVSDEERESVIEFVKNHCEAEYDQSVQSQIEKAAEEKNSSKGNEPAYGGGDTHSDFDELLPQAVDVVLEAKQASVSMLQRRLKLGYSRAARIVDQMEELGVVGPFEGSKPRQILITREQWLEMQTVQGTAPMDTIPDLPEVSDEELFGVRNN